MRIERGKGIIPNVNIDETNEGDERQDKIGCEFDASIEGSDRACQRVT